MELNLNKNRTLTQKRADLAGNNAYFIRKDLLNEKVKELSIDAAYKKSKFRESRNNDNTLSYVSGENRFEILKGLEVLNVKTNQLEKL